MSKQIGLSVCKTFNEFDVFLILRKDKIDQTYKIIYLNPTANLPVC